jgi:Polyketide cyclase / dehydrase and lipid transport
VRMPLLRGSWTIEPLDATRSRVVYQVAVDPGGRLPGWLVRRGAVSALPDVIEQVRRRLGAGGHPRS